MKCVKYNNKLTCTRTQEITTKVNFEKSTANKTNTMYTYLSTCWKCNKFGHVAKGCRNNPSDATLNDQQEQTMIRSYWNVYNTSSVPPIKSPTTILPTTYV